MRKYIAAILVAVMIGLMVPMFADTVNAQTTHYTRRVHKKRSFYKRHRDKLNVAMGAGAGAATGALIGGKRGAGIGTLAGGGGAALYTYKLRHRKHRHYRKN